MCGGDPARVNGATWKQSTRTQNALPVEVVALSLSIRAAASDSSRMVGITGQSLPVFMASVMMDFLWSDLHMTHQSRSWKSGDSFYRPFRTA
jgi:hypothetical protein